MIRSLLYCTGKLGQSKHRYIQFTGKCFQGTGDVRNLLLPADASIAKISDVYRKVIYMKAPEYATLVACKDLVERKIKNNSTFSNVSVQFDFNPTSGF